MQPQLAVSRSDCKTLRAANDHMAESRDADRKGFSTLRARVL